MARSACSSISSKSALLPSRKDAFDVSTPDAPVPVINAPRMVQFLRTSRGWETTRPLFVPGITPGRPAVIAREIGGFRHAAVSPKAAWRRYFPAMRAAGSAANPWPAPFSQQFKREYAEPVGEFLAAARMFRDAVCNVKEATLRDVYLEAEQTLHALSCGARPLLYPSSEPRAPRAFRLGWTCHSLLTSLALMAVIDLSQGLIRRCAREDCGSFYVTMAPNGSYCSRKCGSAVRKRRVRERQKIMRAAPTKGEPKK